MHHQARLENKHSQRCLMDRMRVTRACDVDSAGFSWRAASNGGDWKQQDNLG